MNEAILLKALLETDKSGDVRRLIDEYVSANQLSASWLPVGGRANNSGTIQAAGDPMRALIERVTNAIDAVIDRAHSEHSGKPTCKSPREATQAWFGVPKQGLHKMTDGERRKLAQESVHVTLWPGDGKSKRAIEIADRGLGLTASQMPKTILSLNESNKLDKFYLAGAFGQGGSATLASSEATLIASKSISDPSVVAFTVVRYDPPKGVKLGSYVYLVSNGEVPTTSDIPVAFGDFSTKVRHYGYDLDDYGGKLGPNSVYGRSQTILFDPVLPFWFETKLHDFSRTIKGSRAALNGAKDDEDVDSKVAHSVPLFFTDLGEFGQIGIEYWVLQAKEKGAASRAFVNSAKPILVTVNGQLHAEWSANLLRKDADLLHITSRTIVHLDCNRLSLDAKNALFVSNREESRKGQLQNLILQEMLNALKSDDRLQELNEEAKNAGWKERDEEAEKEVRKEVARMLKVFGFSVMEEAGAKPSEKPSADGATPAKGKAKVKKLVPVPVSEPPTFVEFVSEQPVQLFPGQRRFIRVRTDANSTYHDAADPTKSLFRVIVDGQRVRFVGSTELREGHMRCIVAADTEAVVGNSGTITVELRPPATQTITATAKYEIVSPPAPKSTSAKINLPNIDIQPVTSMDDEEWSTFNWPSDAAEVAADYNYAGDTLTIRYSTLFPRFGTTFQNMHAKDPALASSFQKRYEIWLTTAALIHWQDTQSDATPLDGASLEQDDLDGYRRDEIRRLAKNAIVYAQREVTYLGTAEAAAVD